MKQCAERKAYGDAFGPNVQDMLVSSLEGMMTSSNGGEGEKDEKKKLFGMF
jgi:hypothetical protein